MRFLRLDLLRYGRFTDRSLTFPSSAVDLHIVYGPNEAGKSTTQSAIEDFLFGFPTVSRYAFAHENSALRVGAVVTRGEVVLEARRRKGKKDTLTGADDRPLPLGDGALKTLFALGSVDREFYARMLSLDHVRLLEGGKQLLDARDDIGRMLFEAGAGLGSLRAVLSRCDEDAEKIFAPRAKNRTFNNARERLDAADENLRAAAVAAPAGQAAARAVETLHRQRDELARTLDGEHRQRRRKERIRRVLPLLGELHRLQAARGALGPSPVLPVDAAALLERTVSDLSQLSHREQALAEALAQLQPAADDQDDPVLDLEPAIGALVELRALATATESGALTAELAERRRHMTTLMDELSGPRASPLVELIDVERALPGRPDLARVRELYEQWGALDEAHKAAQQQVLALQHKQKGLRSQLKVRPLGLDSSMLASTIPMVRKSSNRTTEMARLRDQHAATSLRRSGALAQLRRFSGSADELARLPVPSTAAIAEMARRRQELERSHARLEADLTGVRAELRDEELTADQLVRDRHIVSTERVTAARAERDGLWVQAQLPDREPEIVTLFARAMALADQLADRRFDGVNDAARLVEVQQRIERLASRVVQLQTDEDAWRVSCAAADEAWRALWIPSAIAPGSPEEMTAWLDARAQILALDERWREEAERLGRLEAEQLADKQTLLSALSLSADDAERLAAAPLELVLAEAERRNDEVTQKEGAQAEQQRQHDHNLAELAGARRSESEAAAEVAAWRAAWADAVARIGRPADERLEATRAALDVLDELRQEARQARTLHDRRQQLVADTERFTAEAIRVARLVAVIGAEPVALTGALAERLERARERRTRRLQREQQRTEQTAHHKKVSDERGLVEARLLELLRAAGSATVEEARTVIVRAAEQLRLDGELERAARRLNEAGDGLPRSELEAECAGIDRDALPDEIDALVAQIDRQTAQLSDLNVAAAAAELELSHIDGGTGASVAVQEQQLALAELRDEAERFVRLRAQSELLRWVIDRYRLQKQAPLLTRASHLFHTLTDGNFAELRVELDDQDRARLVGMRQDKPVAVEGMSTASVDQLYLALRLAAIEDYLDRSAPLPLVIDDLFVHFDDTRTIAGLKTLSELAQRTQVLVFTHHAHLVELARQIGVTSIIDL